MKVVIPAAGLGTRLLPATKAQPKEMLPIVDKPAIQYVVEEAVRASLTDILIVTARGKHAIENHFDRSIELEHHLKSSGSARGLSPEVDKASIFYVRQREHRGLGDAVLHGRPYVGGEYFAVMLGDDVFISKEPCIAQLLAVHRRYKAPVVGVGRVGRESISRYGVIAGREVKKGLFRVSGLVEKPEPEEAPSDLAVIGRYILPPKVFDYLAQGRRGKNGEIQLTDSLDRLAREGPFYAVLVEGRRFDIGDKLGLLRAGIEVGLLDPEIGPELRRYIKGMKLR